MNFIQRFIMLTAIFVAILLHTYFCDWRLGSGDPFLTFSVVKVDGKQWMEIITRELHAQGFNSGYVLNLFIAEFYGDIDDSTQYDAVEGIYPDLTLSTPEYINFILGIILPIVFLATGVFVAAKGRR